MRSGTTTGAHTATGAGWTWRATQALGLAALVTAAILWAFPGRGIAAGPSFVSTTPSGLAGTGSTTTITYPTGASTSVTIKVSGFPAVDPLDVLECSDAGGSTANYPTDTTTCENLAQPATTDSSGAATLHYGVVVDSTGSGGATCDQNNYCVLWVGDDSTNLSGSNHLWTAAFEFTQPTTTTTTTTTTSTTTTTTEASGTTTTTTTTEAGGTTTTTSSTTTTTAGAGGATTTTTPGSSTSSEGGVTSPDDSSGSSAAAETSSASGSQLAFTGPPPVLPYLVVFGALFLVTGTVGRRLSVRMR